MQYASIASQTTYEMKFRRTIGHGDADFRTKGDLASPRALLVAPAAASIVSSTARSRAEGPGTHPVDDGARHIVDIAEVLNNCACPNIGRRGEQDSSEDGLELMEAGFYCIDVAFGRSSVDRSRARKHERGRRKQHAKQTSLINSL